MLLEDDIGSVEREERLTPADTGSALPKEGEGGTSQQGYSLSIRRRWGQP
jgi:hypothetical protein